jgi:uracil permease
MVAFLMGMIDLSVVKSAAWFYNPWQNAIAEGRFEWPVWSLAAILLVVPAAIAPALEHIGDMLAISSVSGKDYCAKPGLHKTMLGDGVATTLAGLLGGPPNTTYSEVTGAVAMTRVFEARVMQIAALFSIAFSFVGKLSALLSTIPTPVIGGVMVVIFGMIASVGIRLLLENKPDLSDNRNAIIFAVILVCGVGNFTIEIGTFTFGGLGLAALMGVFLNQVLPYSTSLDDNSIKGKE